MSNRPRVIEELHFTAGDLYVFKHADPVGRFNEGDIAMIVGSNRAGYVTVLSSSRITFDVTNWEVIYNMRRMTDPSSQGEK